MKEQEMATLKRKVVEEPDLKNVFDYFFDHFGEDMAFIKSGKPIRHELLLQLLPMLVRQVMTQPATVMDIMLVHVPEHQFIHGGFTLREGILGNLIYFEDIQTGVIALSRIPPTGFVQFMRFNATMLLPPGEA
jgi:hypothetical protein